MKTPKPALHQEFPMESRVEVKNDQHLVIQGVICGVAHVGIIFHYIVQLDNPMEIEFGLVRCIAVPGVYLRLL